MRIACITESICPHQKANSPWILYADFLRKNGFEIHSFEAADEAPWKERWDAMIYMAWHDWGNFRFKPQRIMESFAKYSTYRSQFPETIQICCNHSDMSRYSLVTPYWRMRDPILFRTPSYDRSELSPLPPGDIHAYEVFYKGFDFSHEEPKFNAALICNPTGPQGYRASVAEQVAKVGYGLCLEGMNIMPIKPEDYIQVMSRSRILVCPRGWGGQSQRHWDAWRAKKPVLTDVECASVEMIPGVRLKENEHYLVYRSPEEIPDIVSDWSKPSKADDLKRIAENGHAAAMHPQDQEILKFFIQIQGRPIPAASSASPHS